MYFLTESIKTAMTTSRHRLALLLQRRCMTATNKDLRKDGSCLLDHHFSLTHVLRQPVSFVERLGLTSVVTQVAPTTGTTTTSHWLSPSTATTSNPACSWQSGSTKTRFFSSSGNDVDQNSNKMATTSGVGTEDHPKVEAGSESSTSTSDAPPSMRLRRPTHRGTAVPPPQSSSSSSSTSFPWTNNNSNTSTSSSSSLSQSSNWWQSSLSKSSSSPPNGGGGERRPHAITLFPGDFDDDIDDDDDDNGDNDEYRKKGIRRGVDNDDDDEDDWMDPASTARRDPAEQAALQAWKEQQEKEAAQRARWIANSRPPIYTSKIDDRGRAYGRGGRKRAQARVWIYPAGTGDVVVNRQPLEDYFVRLTNRDHVIQPLIATETIGLFDVQAIVRGGGLSGQAGAIRHGLARALHHYNPDLYRPALKRLGFLTRDPRKVERKKIGHKKARKSPQWVRR